MKLYAAALLSAMALTLSGCVVASPDDDTYGDAAASSLGTAASEVSTVEKMLRLLDEHRIFSPSVVGQLRYSEESLARASRAFGALNPPPSQDTLRGKADQLFDEAQRNLTDARIAVHRHESATYSDIADELASLAKKLTKLETSAS